MRIVLVEDHLMFREILRIFCAKELKADVVGEAGSGQEAMRIIRKVQPDCVLLDLHLPEGDGFEVAEFTLSRWPSTKVLMLSSHCDDYTLLRVEQSGAHGFVDKGSQTLNDLRRAFAALARDEKFYSPAYDEAKRARASDLHFSQILSKQECVVLSLIGQSFSDQEIARQLGITPTTAQTHRSHIMRKLDVSGTAKLIQFALEHGFTRVVTQRNGKSVLP